VLDTESTVYTLREADSEVTFNPLAPILGGVLKLRDTLRLPAGSIPHPLRTGSTRVALLSSLFRDPTPVNIGLESPAQQ
jgi:hypothetical protein